MSGHTVETDDGNSKVISQTSRLTLALYILKLVLYFNSIIISNQIKYYLAINRWSFHQIRYDFYKHAFRIHNQQWWLVIERACTKSSVSRTWLFVASWWNVTVWNGSYRFAFLTRGAEIVNTRAVTRIGIWLAGISTFTQGHVICKHCKSLQRFQGVSAF